MRITELPESLYSDAVALWHESGLTRPWNDPEADLRRAANGPASTVLAGLGDGGLDDGRLLGTAMVGHDGHRGWIYYLAVAPSCRGKGVGRRLMEACEQWVSDHDIAKIQLMVRDRSTNALAFYTAIGYVDTEVIVLGRRLD